MSNFATRLKNLRAKMKVSQEDVANALGITRTAYVKYETGVSRPKKINELANYFGVSTDYLLGHDEPTPQLQDSPEEKNLVEGFRILTEEGKNTLINVLNSLKITKSAV